MKIFIAVIILVLVPGYGFSETAHHERTYQEFWCRRAGGLTEVVLTDHTRVDCLTGEYAVEVDFAVKWAEAVGQALFYGAMTGRKAGVLLIMEKDGDGRYLKRLKLTIEEFALPIRIWTTRPQDIE